MVDGRTDIRKPLSYSGVDTTGNVFVQENDSSVKMFVVIFNCFNIKVYHLEVVPSLYCQDFLQSFIRFSSGHTILEKIISDYANTFLRTMGLISRADM